MHYEKNNYKKFKNLKYGDNKLIGNHGMWAEANKNQTISFKIMKRIKKINETNYSPFRGTLGYFPSMSIEKAELEALKIIKLCNKGIHPRKKIFSNKGFKIKETSKRKIVIIGTGGHTTSLLNIITTPPYQVVAFVDKLKTSKKFNKIRVINDEEAISKYYDCEFIIGIGDNNIREKLLKMYSKKIKRIKFATLIHDSAIISRNVKIEEGSVVMPNVTVGPNTKVGKFCILNTHSSLDHDCLMDDFSSIAPGVNTGGEVTIGKNSCIGIGAKIKNNITIGKNVIIGGASFVNKNIKNNLTCFGVPVKIIRDNYKK